MSVTFIVIVATIVAAAVATYIIVASPTNPINTTSPTNPTNHTNTTNPTNPTNPTNTTNTTSPTNPTYLFTKPLTITGHVFYDKNRNNIHDEDEYYIEGIKVCVKRYNKYTQKDEETSCTNTGSDGSYSLSTINTYQDTHKVYIDDYYSWGQSIDIPLRIIEDDMPYPPESLTIDFRVVDTKYKKTVIWGYVFNDTNANGVWDESEQRVEGIELCLRKKMNIYKGEYKAGRINHPIYEPIDIDRYTCTTSDNDGYYIFEIEEVVVGYGEYDLSYYKVINDGGDKISTFIDSVYIGSSQNIDVGYR